MNWSDIIAENLPAPRDDEPSSLRQDIADELADHLQCAVRREALITPDEELARRKVLDRFGNPQQIARQLWLDALWEKIMSQRIMLAVTIVLALTCLTATGMTWFVVNQGRTAAEAMAAESRAANAALLAQIAKLSATPTTPPPSLEWNKVQVRLVTPDGKTKIPPGFTVSLAGNVLDAGKSTTIKATLGPDGVADFGLVRAGHHQLIVQADWGEGTSHSIDVRPGQTHTEEVICPPTAPQEADIKVSVDWPDDLRGKQLWLISEFLPYAQLREDSGNRTIWSIGPPAGRHQVLAISPSGTFVNFEYKPRFPGRSRATIFGSNREISRANPPSGRRDESVLPEDDEPGVRLDAQLSKEAQNRGPATNTQGGNSGRPLADLDVRLLFGIPTQEQTSHLRWPALRYLRDGFIIATKPEASDGSSLTELTVISGLLDSEQIANVTRRFSQYRSAHRATIPRFVTLDRKTSSMNQPVMPTFCTAVAGQMNEWKITLPEELVKIVREELAKAE